MGVFGLEDVAPKFDPPEKKTTFVCVWFAFAMSLYWLNRFHGRKTYPGVQFMNDPTTFAFWWKAVVLMCAGVAGGLFSSMTGSGIDICSFSVLTLLFRVSEKVATPTSVVLMAINTVIGYLYRDFGMDEISDEARYYLYACLPIVVVGAPLGSILGSHLHRLTLAWIVYIIDTAQLIGAYFLVDFDNHKCLKIIGIVIIVFGGVFFTILAQWGEYLQALYEGTEAVDLIVDDEREFDQKGAKGSWGDLQALEEKNKNSGLTKDDVVKAASTVSLLDMEKNGVQQ